MMAMYKSDDGTNEVHLPVIVIKTNKETVYSLLICFTPLIVFSFFISFSSRFISSTLITMLPLNKPSELSTLMLRIMIFSSFDMMLVILLSMPMLSLPISETLVKFV